MPVRGAFLGAGSWLLIKGTGYIQNPKPCCSFTFKRIPPKWGFDAKSNAWVVECRSFHRKPHLICSSKRRIDLPTRMSIDIPQLIRNHTGSVPTAVTPTSLSENGELIWERYSKGSWMSRASPFQTGDEPFCKMRTWCSSTIWCGVLMWGFWVSWIKEDQIPVVVTPWQTWVRKPHWSPNQTHFR